MPPIINPAKLIFYAFFLPPLAAADVVVVEDVVVVVTVAAAAAAAVVVDYTLSIFYKALLDAVLVAGFFSPGICSDEACTINYALLLLLLLIVGGFTTLFLFYLRFYCFIYYTRYTA